MASALRLEVPRELAGERLDRALEQLVPGRTRSQLQKLVRRGRVSVDGRTVNRSNVGLRGGEAIVVRDEGLVAAQPAPELRLVHVEEQFVVVDKPAGMLTHPVQRVAGGSGSVAEELEQRFGPLPSADDALRPGIVHRLDFETSGLLVAARTQAALDDLRQQFRERRVEKRYVALVEGEARDERFVVEEPLLAVPGSKDLQRIDPRGKEARTEFEVIGRRDGRALIECRPRTGRRHQIRVHLAHVGLPIVDDALYGSRGPAATRHCLHAAGLAFESPGGGGRQGFESPAPAWPW